MKRKVIKQGNGTLTMTLPKQWTESFGVKAGKEIDVEAKGKDLIIHSGKPTAEEKINIKLSTAEKFLVRYLENPYRQGYNEMYISFEDTDIIKRIRAALPGMMGFEIIEQGAKHCIIKQLMSDEEKEFDTTLRRLFHLVGALGKDCNAATKEKDKKKMEDLILNEHLTNKFANFCERILNKRAYSDPKQTNLLYYITAGLELIADKYKDICNYLKSETPAISKEVLKLLEETNNCFEEYESLFYKFSKDAQFKLRQDKKQISQKIKTINTKNIQDIIILEQLVTILDIIEHMSMRTYESHHP